MLNLLKMEVNRFFTNKMMYILLAVFMAFQVFGIFMMKQYEEPVPGMMLPSAMNESEFIQSLLAQTPSWLMMYIMVFTVYFYMSEYNAGFYKNYIAMERARSYGILAKVIVLGLFTLMMFVALLIADFIGRPLFFDNATLGDPGYFVKLIIGQFLLHWAFAVVILCITMLLKNLVASFIVGLVLVLNVIGMGLKFLESLLWDLEWSGFLLVNTIVTVRDFNETQTVIHVYSVALLFLLIASLIAIRFKMKEDLK